MATTNYVFVSSEAQVLADNPQWINRFKFLSSSGKQYTIAQNKEHRHWGCSCTGWRMRRRCRHLDEHGIPNHEQPYEAQLAVRDNAPVPRRMPEPRTRPPLRMPPPEVVRLDKRSAAAKPRVIIPPKPKVVDFGKLPKRAFSLDEDV